MQQESSSFSIIADHVEKYLGPIELVLHPTASSSPLINILMVKATEERPFHILVTAGMSDTVMAIPEHLQAESSIAHFAELMIALPSSWQLPELYEVLGHEASNTSANLYEWPISLLRTCAAIPREYQTWLGFGHTIPHGDPPIPYASNTELCGALILPSLLVPQEFQQLVVDDHKRVEILGIFPLYQEEMQLKVDQGVNALLTRFEQYQLIDCIMPNRINVAKI